MLSRSTRPSPAFSPSSVDPDDLLRRRDSRCRARRHGASSVSDDYDGEASVFNGTVNWVQIDPDEAAEDFDHLITPEERLRVAMARQ